MLFIIFTRVISADELILGFFDVRLSVYGDRVRFSYDGEE